MALKTKTNIDLELEKFIPMIEMFSNWFPSDEDYETMVVIVELVYPMIFHPISLSMGLSMRLKWASPL